MIETDEPLLGNDIGVVATAQAPAPAYPGRRRRSHRSLPVWVVVALALLVGWLLGSLLGNRESGEAVAPVVEADSVATVEPTPVVVRQSVALPALQTAPSQTTPGQTDPEQTIPLSGASLVLAQLSGADRLPSAVTWIDDRGSSTVRVDQRIAGPTQQVGQVGDRVQLVGSSVVFVAGRQAVIVDIENRTEPQMVGDATTLLAGSGDGEVWALADQGRTARLLDVETASVRATYDLSAVGRPLASFNGGLVVGPMVDEFGAFGVWSPARGIERLWTLDDQATFIDATGNVLIVHTAQGLATYDTVTGSLAQTNRRLTQAERQAAFVSPDGSRLAIVERRIRDATAVVNVVELAQGATIDQFDVAAPWLVDWVASDELIFLAADQDEAVTVRDTTLGVNTTLVTLGTEVTWMTIAE